MINVYQRTSTAPTQRKRRKTPESPVDLNNLCKAIRKDREELSIFRQKRYFLVRQAAGDGYGNNTTLEQPFNVLNLYYDVMTSSVIGSDPRIMAKTPEEKNFDAVDAWEGWANQELIAMDAASIFRRAFQDALSWMGIVRVTLATVADAEASGWGMVAGQPFMESIDPEDFVCDQGARTFDRVSYAGCRYRIPVKLANDIYKSAHEFTPDEDTTTNYGGDDRIQMISRTPGWREEAEEHCTIWEIWHPKHKKIELLRDNGGVPDPTHGPIAVKQWIGVPRGPYFYLGLNFPAGNLNPNGPANHLAVLSTNLNSQWRKLLRQTKDYKKMTLYRGTATKDAERVQTGKDGAMLNVDDPEGIMEREFGGAGQALWAMARATQEAFNYIGGNIGLMSGRGAQSKTATQDKLLADNASAGLASIQGRTYSFMGKGIDAWKWLTWNHPTKVMDSVWQSQIYPDLSMPRRLGPWNSNMRLRRAGKMPAIELDIYSLARQTPQSRLAFIQGFLAMIQPFMGELKQQGISLDAATLVDIGQKFGNEPLLKKLLHYAEPPAPDANGEVGSGGKPAETTRTYNRYGAGEDSEAAESADIDAQFSEMQKGPMNPNSGV